MLHGSEICKRGKTVARLVLKCPVMQRRVESSVMRRFLLRHRSVSLAIGCGAHNLHLRYVIQQQQQQ